MAEHGSIDFDDPDTPWAARAVNQVRYNDDGSWTVVVAHRDPAHPNWVSPQGHRQGRIWGRWFLPSDTPQPLRTRVVPVDESAWGR